jgi:dTDP-4-dehydrorhamnose reductase
VETCRLRLDSRSELARVIEEINAAVIIHAAGMTNVDACEENPDGARYANVDLAVSVAAAARSSGCSMVHISTDHLFGGSTGLVNEDSEVAPVNVYGRTKAEAEARVLETYPDAIVVRTNFYGWGPSYRRSFSDMIIDSLRIGVPITLFDDVYYTPILADALVAAVHELVDAAATGIFNIAGDDRLSKHEFGLRVARHFSLDQRLIRAGSIEERRSLVRRPHNMSLSNEKLTDLVGRTIGGVDEHLNELRRQEDLGRAREVCSL